MDFLGGTSGKKKKEKTACQRRSHKRRGFDFWLWKIPRRKPWQPTPVILPGESVDSGAWQATAHGVAQESDTTEAT